MLCALDWSVLTRISPGSTLASHKIRLQVKCLQHAVWIDTLDAVLASRVVCFPVTPDRGYG